MKTIGKYVVKGLLGVGGMGAVYKVELPIAGRILALKLLRPRDVLEAVVGLPRLEELFLDEVRLLGSIRHENVVDVLDVDRDASGRPFYVMDYHCVNLGVLLGEDYESEHPCRALPVDEAAAYARQILAALERLHDAHVVHRDVKPFNVMITAEDRVKLIDFGLSKVRGEGAPLPGGIAVGTPFYTAPELEADPRRADPRSDLYGVGVLLWRMLTGRMPGQSPADYQAPSRLNPLLTEDWDILLKKSVAPNPDKRFQSAAEMAATLRATHEDWKEDMQHACRLVEQEPKPAPAPRALRAEPLKLGPAEAREVFPVDELMRPKGLTTGDFEVRGAVVRHGSTDRVWQREASRWPMTWPEANAHVARLNTDAFAGHTDWRLPTADELLSVLSPATGIEGYCLPGAFTDHARWLWSADRKSYACAWFADTRLGFVWFQDFSCAFHVRAVRSMTL